MWCGHVESLTFAILLSFNLFGKDNTNFPNGELFQLPSYFPIKNSHKHQAILDCKLLPLLIFLLIHVNISGEEDIKLLLDKLVDINC